MTISNILMPFGSLLSFGIFYGHLVQFVFIWYILPVLVCLNQEKSGNPGMGAYQ
jgi:hypothetical protein